MYFFLELSRYCSIGLQKILDLVLSIQFKALLSSFSIPVKLSFLISLPFSPLAISVIMSVIMNVTFHRSYSFEMVCTTCQTCKQCLIPPHVTPSLFHEKLPKEVNTFILCLIRQGVKHEISDQHQVMNNSIKSNFIRKCSQVVNFCRGGWMKGERDNKLNDDVI